MASLHNEYQIHGFIFYYNMNTRVILKNIPQDLLQLADFEVVDELLRPALMSGQILIKVEWVSVDSIQRAWLKGGNIYMQSVKPGECVDAYGVGVVIDSRDSLYRVGNRVVGKLGWQMYAIVNSNEVSKVPYYEKPQLYLSVLGIPGLTAYFGLIDLGKPKQNEVVLVSSAAGAVGSIVCQLARMKECTVIGLAGSDKKCNYVTSVLGASACVNHRKGSSLSSVLSSLCPGGIDIYFDTVGGYILDTVLLHLNKYSRILLSEASSTYNTIHPHPLYNYP